MKEVRMGQIRKISKALSLSQKVFLGKPFLICVAAVIIYTLAGFFLAPYLVKRQLTAYVSETLGRKVSFERLRVNPYALTRWIYGVLASRSLTVRRFFHSTGS